MLELLVAEAELAVWLVGVFHAGSGPRIATPEHVNVGPLRKMGNSLDTNVPYPYVGPPEVRWGNFKEASYTSTEYSLPGATGLLNHRK